jgi:hypothetical protein
MAFKKYLTRKGQGWFQSWGRDKLAATPLLQGLEARKPSSTVPATQARPAAPTASDDDKDVDLTAGQDKT